MKLTIRLARRFTGIIFVCGCLITLLASHDAWGQDMSTGAVTVTVQDPAGAAVNGAQLALKDLDTNAVRTATTRGAGGATIPYLNFGHYSLTVTKDGFSTKSYPSITVQTNQVTDINVKLAVGNIAQQVTVSAESSPILDTSSNTLSTTVDLKQVNDLPLYGRNLFSLAFLVPGAVDNDINNLPGGAVNYSMGGFSDISNRNKSGGFDTIQIGASARVENMQEMTVQSGELDASKGGTAAMDIGFVTKRGTNKFHGMLFEDYRNDAMNANSWYNNNVGLPRPKEIINDFGATIGGPFLKDKLFFFASLSNFREPVKSTVSTAVANAQALRGIYAYYPNNSTTLQTTNLFQDAQNPALGGSVNNPGAVNPIMATELGNIATASAFPGTTVSFLDPNHNTLSFLNKGYIVDKYPTGRIDYNLTQNFRLTGSANGSMFYNDNTGPGPYPGPIFANQTTSGLSRNYQVVAGFDWNVKPNLVNAFRAGYLYTGFEYASQGGGYVPGVNVQIWGFNMASGINQFNDEHGGQLTPVLSLKDDTTWQHGSHNISFGAEISTELDHYYNQPQGPAYVLTNTIANGDPVANPLTNALSANAPASAPGDVQSLYATLTGRLTGEFAFPFVDQQTKQFTNGVGFDLHERLTQAALFVEDAWKVNPELTLNLGLRWDFTGASKDETGFYTHPSIAALWGPSGVGNLFKPGTLTGEQNPVERASPEAYAPTYVHPEPNIGFAWNPHGSSDSTIGRLLGDGKTVIRGSYTFKNYTEGAQNFWNFASNFGAGYESSDTLQAAPGVTGPGFFAPGSLSFGDALPPFLMSPATYSPVLSESALAFNVGGFNTFDPHIKQPYVESWELGIQRQLGQNNVLEVRYVGNVSRDQWEGVNYNEINIFENGFLSEFQKAQANLAASGGTTLRGANPLPILSQAFAATEPGNFSNGQFITDVQQGQAGALATSIAGNSAYLCSLVGAANFAPCTNVGASGSGTYPINFFQANPYAAGGNISELSSVGYSNYNSLQVDFRQRPTRGMEFDANYTLAHALENNVQGSTSAGSYGGRPNSAPSYYTLRNRHLNYLPSVYDVRHVLHVSGTYDLPFGHNREFLNQSRLLDAAVGGWTLGTILTYQSGEPWIFYGGTQTVNQSDSGITLTGVTPSQLQKQIRIRHAAPGDPWVDLFDPKYINTQGQANTQYISPEFTAGQFGRIMSLHAPKWINTDIAATKVVPIRGNLTFSLQVELLNAFNHVAWAGMNSTVQSNTFGTTSSTANGPRNIELRGNFEW